MTEPLLRAAQLTKVVTSGDAPLTILDDVGFAINPGDAVAVVGASGSGKTTLLGLLAGLDRPTRGDVWLDGNALSGLDEDARARLEAAAPRLRLPVVPVAPASDSARERDASARARRRNAATATARDWLARVGLAKRTTHYPKQLSGGEQQRVAIARAFAGEPKLLMADEPTGNLDNATGLEVVDLMFRLNREHGTTLLLVTHDVSLAGRVRDGSRSRQDGSSATIASIRRTAPMNTLRLAWRMLSRDWRAGELTILIAAMVLAVASIGTVGFFADRVKGALGEAGESSAGRRHPDIRRPAVASAFAAEAQSRGLVSTPALRFNSMVRREDGMRPPRAPCSRM